MEMDRPSLSGGRPLSLKSLKPLSFNNGNEEKEDYNRILSLASGKLKFPDEPDNEYTFCAANLQDLGPIGSGNFGTVYKMRHIDSGREMAVKRIRSHNINGREQEQLLREHNTIVASEKCVNIVKFFGVIFHEGDCWICMELMDVSLDRLCRRVYHALHQRLEEPLIGHVAVSTIHALDYLKRYLKIMHRDVKPSNILVGCDGVVKLCDFGICGELENSVAKTHDVGCQPYLAPERVTKMLRAYDVRSDIWSFGITMYEISKGEFPYKSWCSPFEQITAVVKGDAPMLSRDDGKFVFSHEFVTFVNKCLTKDYHLRPKYDQLKKEPFYVRYDKGEENRASTCPQLGEFAMDALNNPEIQKA